MSYGKAPPVLNGADLDVAAGEIVVLTGPNGSGKTTLLRVLATSLLATAGRAVVAGHDVRLEPERVRRRVGAVFAEDRTFDARLGAGANLAFFAGLSGLRGGPARDRAYCMLAEVGLGNASDTPFRELSTGQRLRLALARALLVPRDVLLLDEPTRSLDPEGRARLHATLQSAAAQGTAVLLVSHAAAEPAALDARTLKVVDGRVVPCP